MNSCLCAVSRNTEGLIIHYDHHSSSVFIESDVVLLCSSVAMSLLIQMEKLSFTIFQNRLQIARRCLFYWSNVAGMYCFVDIIYVLHAVLTQIGGAK
jgi:hypothetical protein